MKNFMTKKYMKFNYINNNTIYLITFLISEIICILITRFNINLSGSTYFTALNIIQPLYFFPILITSYFIFLCSNSKNTLIFSTIGLIIYSVILHIFITQLGALFTNSTGTINFIKYSSKIYFICLPLISFRIYNKKYEKNFYFKLFIDTITFLILTLLSNYFFYVKGVLYIVPIFEFIYFIISILKSTKNPTR